jgi:hypothetical protein
MQPEDVDLGDRYKLRYANRYDAYSVLRDLREADREEWNKSVLGGVRSNLAQSITQSAEAYTVVRREDDVAQVIFGVVDSKPVQTTWLLGTNEGQRIAGSLSYSLHGFYSDLFFRHPHTRCYSDPGNEVHHRWLQWLGYKLIGTEPWGPYGDLFLLFDKDIR